MLGSKLVELYHFGRQMCGLLETFCEKHYFCDHPVLGYHHRHGSEQYLEIIWELDSAFVARIHGDENAALFLESSHFPVEFELLLSHYLRQTDIL